MSTINPYSAGIPYVLQTNAAKAGKVKCASGDEYQRMIEETESQDDAGSVGAGSRLYNGSTVRAKLSDTEIAVLANKYDVHDMSDEEYDAFLDDLESMGAISNYEKTYELGYKNMSYLGFGDAKCGNLMTSVWQAPLGSGGRAPIFERRDAKGDISRWINDRIQWKPSYSSDPGQKKAQEECVKLHETLAEIINRVARQRGAVQEETDAKAELVRQLADENSEFYANMRMQLKAQVEKNKEDEEQQAIIDALGAVLDALSGKEDASGSKTSLIKSSADLTQKISERISKLEPDDPERVRLENMLKRLQEMGIYVDLNGMDDLWQNEDETFETLTQFLIRRQAEETSKTHPIINEVNEPA